MECPTRKDSRGSGEVETYQKKEIMIHKINTLTVLFRLSLIGIMFTFLFCYVSPNFNFLTYFISFLIIVGLEVFLFFIKPFLTIIIVNEDSISLHYRKFLINASVKKINLNEFSFSYKREKGARGIEKNELRLYENGKKIIGIGSGFDGWAEETIYKIIEDLKKNKS